MFQLLYLEIVVQLLGFRNLSVLRQIENKPKQILVFVTVKELFQLLWVVHSSMALTPLFFHLNTQRLE